MSAIVRAAAVLLLFAIVLGGCGSTDTFLEETGLPKDSAVIVDAKGDVRDVDGEKAPDGAPVADMIRAVGTVWERTSGPDVADRMAFGDQATVDDSEGWTGYPNEWSAYPAAAAD